MPFRSNVPYICTQYVSFTFSKVHCHLQHAASNIMVSPKQVGSERKDLIGAQSVENLKLLKMLPCPQK